MPEITVDQIKKEFIKYLTALGISPKSHKNYRSDLNNFVAWAILKIRSYGSYVQGLADIVPFLSRSLVDEYKADLVANKTPTKTINRRLSTLRHLSRFLIAFQITDVNFMEGIENDLQNGHKKKKNHPLVSSFKSALESEGVSPNTVKNYLSDIKQFMEWLDRQNPSI